MTDEEHPDYVCPACDWQMNEEDAIHCECGRLLCPRKCCITGEICSEPLITIEAYRQAEADNARDAQLEDRGLKI